MASSKTLHYEWFTNLLSKIFWWILVGMVVGCKGFALSGELWKKQDQQVKQPSQLQKQQYQPQNSKGGGRWRKKLLFLGVVLGILVSIWIFLSMNANIISRRKETLENMCDERARMLQEQFNVSMNHVNALAILVSTFHHGKNPSAIDQVFAYSNALSLIANVFWQLALFVYCCVICYCSILKLRSHLPLWKDILL